VASAALINSWLSPTFDLPLSDTIVLWLVIIVFAFMDGWLGWSERHP
jgi:hypothetical protein